MSTPTLDTVPDMEILEDLDFEVEIPCETYLHKSGQPPAAMLVESIHRCSTGNRILICDDCWVYLGSPLVLIRCKYCGAEGVRDERYRIIRRLK